MVQRHMEEIRCAVDTIYHCLTHFQRIDHLTRSAMLDAGYTDWQIDAQLNKPGSKFHASFAQSPMQVVEKLENECPDVLNDLPEPDVAGRVRLSFELGYETGTDGVVALSSLTPEELSAVREEERNGCIIRKVRLSRTLPTNECQLVLQKEDQGYSIITLFPGVMAPPLPRNGASDPFWDNHCFIE